MGRPPTSFVRYAAACLVGLAALTACSTGATPNAWADSSSSNGSSHVSVTKAGRDFRCVGISLPSVDRVNPGGAPEVPIPVQLVDSLDGTTATLNAKTLAEGGLLLDDANLVVTDNERVEFSGAIDGSEISHDYGWTGFKSTLTPNSTMCVVKFTPSSPPVVLLDRFEHRTGIHGIELFAPVALDASTKPSIVETILGFNIVSVNSSAIIETYDANWQRLAGPLLIGMPIALLSVSGGRLENVTRLHPAIVSDDAARNWKAYTGSLRHGDARILGYVTAWAGDECELGNGPSALSTLRRLQAKGKLATSTGGPSAGVLVHAVQGLCRQGQLAEWPSRN